MTEFNELSRRRFLRFVSGGTLAITLAGCGGDDSYDDLGNGGGNNNGSGGENGGNGVGTGGDPSVPSSEAAFASRAAIAEFAHSLPAQDMAVNQQAVLNFMRGKSEVVASGLSESGVWAVFRNSLPFVVLMNRVPGDFDDNAIDFSRAAGTSIPKEGTALLMNAMVSPGYPNEAARVVPALEKGGYEPQLRTASVNALREIGTPSFFFFSGHGGDTVIDGTPYFLLSTSTLVTPALDNALLPEGDLRFIFTTKVPGDPRVFYAISQRWVARYWKFTPGSLVFLSACSSQSAAGQVMIQECLNVGAGAVAGYTDYVESKDADRIQRFMIDRLVGANVLSPREATPQRAFDYDKLLAALARQIGNSYQVTDPFTGNILPGRFVSLKITQGGGDFGLLAPSIAYVLIDERGERAILKGTFGLETDGKVLIDGVDTPVEVWGEDEIRVPLPRTGGGSAGDVQVVVRGRRSNVRRISRWTITGTYFAQLSGQEPLRIEGTVNLVFRADIGEYREEPGNIFIRPTRYAVPTQNSFADISARGTKTSPCSGGGNDTEKWVGEERWDTFLRSSAGAPLVARGIVAFLSLDTITRTGALSLAFASTDPGASSLRLESVDCGGRTDSVPLPPFAPASQFVDVRFPTEESDVTFSVPGKTFAVGGEWDIPGDRMSTPIAYFEWNTATAEFPPDLQAARSR